MSQIGPENKILSNIISWLSLDHENFRIKYCFFLGGIIPCNNQFLKSLDNNNSTSEVFFKSNYYETFNSEVKRIPKNINLFILPSEFDFSLDYLPQDEILPTYQLRENNVFYLQNPSKVTLESKDLLLYNPFQFYSDESYLTQPDLFLINLLNFRFVAPIWSEKHNIIRPHISESLIVPNNLDFFICHHPSMTKIANYKTVSIMTIESSKERKNKKINEFSVLLFNLHTQERKKMNIPLI